MITKSPDPDSELRRDQDDDPHMARDWIFDPKAIQCCPNNNPLIDFAGYKWWTNFHWSKETGPYVWGGKDPKVPEMGTVFDPYLVTLYKSTELELAIEPPNNKYQSWRTSEVCLVDNLGYGRYLASAGTKDGFANLDPNVVFGVFTYQFTEADKSEGPNVHREIDALEVLRGANSNAQFMLQPYDDRPPGLFFKIPPGISQITVTLDWYVDPGQKKTIAKFAIYDRQFTFENLPPGEKPLAQLDATNSDFKNLIPAHGWERFHFNLWLMHGKPPQGRQEVVITGFEYKPPPEI